MRATPKLLSLLAIHALFLPLCDASEAPPKPRVTLTTQQAPALDVEWSDLSMSWTLETSRDLIDWAHLNASGYERPQTGSFKFTEDPIQKSFFRLRKIGSPRIYVVGDSISTPGAWPVKLAPLTGRHTFSQAIGGSQSPNMVGRARGVELAYPLATPTTAGPIRMKWKRHVADRTHDYTRRIEWAYYSKSVSEPTGIEVYQHGRFLGLAKRILKEFTTDYALNPKAIFCAGHGLIEGDQVTFISNDPGYPNDLAVTDSPAAWNFTSANLPSAVVERRVYFAANVTTNSFEIKEYKLALDPVTHEPLKSIDIGSNSTGTQSIECGWEFDLDFTGGTWDVTWTARTKYDDLIWLLEVSANDIPNKNDVINQITIPNTKLLLSQMTEINPRYILVCPPTGSFADRGPGTLAWTNYYDIYMPWVRANHPESYIDTMAIWSATRTAKELSLLQDPTKPELLWITGTPTNQASWQVSQVEISGWYQSWVGPGFTPLHLRTGFNDSIHPNNAGNKLISDAVAAMIAQKGW